MNSILVIRKIFSSTYQLYCPFGSGCIISRQNFKVWYIFLHR